MATAKFKAVDLRVTENPMGAGFIITLRGKLVGTYWFETAGEGRDFIVREFA